MQTKKQLLKAIRRETKPGKGFDQWVLIIEHRCVSAELGLVVVEAQLAGKTQWSGSASVNLPETRKRAPDGAELPSEWDAIGPGKSRYNVLTLELRGKSIMEMAKGFVKRSLEEGKIQDLLPW